MKCEIRTVINLDDEDLLNLIEKCKEKHKLAELIEKALVAYCYQGERAPESKREVTGADDASDDLSHEIRSLAMQLAVISNNVQSNHSFVMEAIGRLSGAVEAAGQRTVIVPAQTGRVVAPVTEEELDDFTVEHVTETHVATEDVMASPEVVTEQPQVAQPAAVKLTEEVPEEKPRKEEPKAEDTPATTESADAAGDDDEEGLSAETAALMAQFFGG